MCHTWAFLTQLENMRDFSTPITVMDLYFIPWIMISKPEVAQEFVLDGALAPHLGILVSV